jgi:hypothetical protein
VVPGRVEGWHAARVCFSATADLVAGGVLVPLGVLSLAQVRHPREAAYAALPLLLGAHQLVESLVWKGSEGEVDSATAHAAAVAYVVFALPVLPLLVPLAVLLLDPGRRRWIAPFVALGAVVCAVMAHAVATHGVRVDVHPHALVYHVGLPRPELWTGLYVLAVMGACLVSHYPGVKLFGLLNLVGITVVALAYREAFASLWCVYAALASLVVLWHMLQRRHHEAELEERRGRRDVEGLSPSSSDRRSTRG